ncbi:MAG: hypothetical protein IJX35_00370 [Candidatus Methanomethylophilaceae archaeon]|nr:hypothetical protein [Candidatus Methanomethylophilaceae archaeon]
MFYYKNEAIGTYKEATKKYILSNRKLTRELAEVYLFDEVDDGYLRDWVVEMVVDEGGLTDEVIVDYALSYLEDMWDPEEGRMMLGYFGYDEASE